MMQKRVKEGVFWTVLLAILAGAYLEILLQWKTVNLFRDRSGLRYEEGGLSREQLEAYEKSMEEGVKLAAWQPEGNQTISAEGIGRSASGTVIKAAGNMELVFLPELKSGGCLMEGDEEGCMISSSLAWELFGSEDVVGNLLLWENIRLRVRGILDRDEPVLVLRQREKEEQMSYVEIGTKDRRPVSNLQQLAVSLGLFGEAYVFQGSLFVSAARLLMSLPPWGIYCFLSRRFLKWCRGFRKKRWVAWLGKCLVLAGAAAGIFCSVSVTPDWIPAQWSDFGFWGEKASELAGWMRERRNFPKVHWEGEVLGCVWRIALWALVSLGCLGGLAWKGRKNGSKGDGQMPFDMGKTSKYKSCRGV